MTVVLLLLASLAWGRDPPGEVAIALQQARVTELARIAAHARDSGAPRGAVTEAMRAYRIDAETLGRMREEAFVAAADALETERAIAVGALGEALARGRAAPSHRATVTAWLGDLDAQIEILDAALADARARPDSPLSADLALDVGERARVVGLAASYDESRSRSEARRLRLRAHALRSRTSSGMSGGLDEVLEAKALEDRAAELDVDVAHSHSLAERVARVQRSALDLVGEHP